VNEMATKQNRNVRPLEERKHMCSDERNALMNFSVGMDALDKALKPLTNKLREIGSYRKIKGAFGIVSSTFDDLVGTMELKQMTALLHNVNLMAWDYHVKSPMGKKGLKDDGMWVPLESLDELVDASRDRCLMCTLDIAEQRKCKLAKALDLIPCSHEDVDLKGCRYFNGL